MRGHFDGKVIFRNLEPGKLRKMYKLKIIFRKRKKKAYKMYFWGCLQIRLVSRLRHEKKETESQKKKNVK